MANLYSGSIDTNGTYKTLAEVTDLTFTKGTKYVIQIQNPAYIREGTTGKGFLVLSADPFEYTAGDEDLYIKTENRQCVVNIAD